MNIPEAQCPFCDGERVGRAVAVLGTVYALPDLYPVTPGHLLIIPARHVRDFMEMTRDEKRDALALAEEMGRRIREGDPDVAGFNIGMNCGEAAGQTVMHAHFHLIPRRPGDTPSPRGGVRGVIPGRMEY